MIFSSENDYCLNLYYILIFLTLDNLYPLNTNDIFSDQLLQSADNFFKLLS